MTNVEPAKRASALISLVDTVAREDRGAAGGDVIMGHGGVKQILEVVRDYFTPGAVDSVYRGVARLLQLKRNAHTMDEYLAQSDLLGRKAELGRKDEGPLSKFPRRRYARRISPFPVPGISVVARQMRRLFAPRGGVARPPMKMSIGCGGGCACDLQ